MLLGRLLASLLLFFTAIIATRSKDDFVEKNPKKELIGRIFPILPPYHGVDFGANFNKLKSTGDAAYFVVRDSIVVRFAPRRSSRLSDSQTQFFPPSLLE